MLLRFLLVSVVTSLGMDAPTATQMESWSCQARTWCEACSPGAVASDDLAPPAIDAVVVIANEPVEAIPADVAPMPDDMTVFATEPTAPMPTDSTAFAGEPVIASPSETPVDAVVETIVAPMPDSTAAFASEPEETMPQGLAAFASEPAQLVETAEIFAAAETLIDDPADQNYLEVVEALTADLTADPAIMMYPGLSLETTVTEAPKPESRIEILDEQPDVAELHGTTEPAKDAKLTEAVRLTRQALRAWVGVLNAPAVVSVGR